MTLTELLTVMAIMALLIGIAVPAARAILDSFETSAGVTNVISAALANARAIALKNSRSAGVRFQQDLRGNQYMILIIHDDVSTGLANGFVAVQGRKPMRLPDNIGLMDLYLVDRKDGGVGNTALIYDTAINGNGLINEQKDINDTSTFSIIFSLSGKLITRQVQVRNRDGQTDDSSTDDVFNTLNNVDIYDIGLFVDDGYRNLWDPVYGGSNDWAWGPENSRRGFIIYNKNDFNRVSPNRRWSDYLRYLETLYVNPHSGRIIN